MMDIILFKKLRCIEMVIFIDDLLFFSYDETIKLDPKD